MHEHKWAQKCPFPQRVIIRCCMSKGKLDNENNIQNNVHVCFLLFLALLQMTDNDHDDYNLPFLSTLIPHSDSFLFFFSLKK